MTPDDVLEIHEGTLACPICHDENGTHVDLVYALTRTREDEDPHFLRLTCKGEVTSVEDDEFPHAFGSTGRRHEFVLAGWCEFCGSWAVSFRQHKGATLVRVVRSGAFDGETYF